MFKFNFETKRWAILGNKSAMHNSNFGSDMVFNGTTLDFVYNNSVQ